MEDENLLRRSAALIACGPTRRLVERPDPGARAYGCEVFCRVRFGNESRLRWQLDHALGVSRLERHLLRRRPSIEMNWAIWSQDRPRKRQARRPRKEALANCRLNTSAR